METQKQGISPVEIAVKYGFLLSLASVLIDFITRIIGLSVLVYSIVAGTLALILMVTCVVLAHKAFKKANGGVMTYIQGIIIALIMLLISSLVSSLFNYLYVNYVDPEFVGRMKDEMTAFMERNRVPQDQIDKSVAKFDDMSPTPLKALLNGLKNGTVGGVVLGAIVSAFTKRKAADFE